MKYTILINALNPVKEKNSVNCLDSLKHCNGIEKADIIIITNEQHYEYFNKYEINNKKTVIGKDDSALKLELDKCLDSGKGVLLLNIDCVVFQDIIEAIEFADEYYKDNDKVVSLSFVNKDTYPPSLFYHISTRPCETEEGVFFFNKIKEYNKEGMSIKDLIKECYNCNRKEAYLLCSHIYINFDTNNEILQRNPNASFYAIINRKPYTVIKRDYSYCLMTKGDNHYIYSDYGVICRTLHDYNGEVLFMFLDAPEYNIHRFKTKEAKYINKATCSIYNIKPKSKAKMLNWAAYKSVGDVFVFGPPMISVISDLLSRFNGDNIYHELNENKWLVVKREDFERLNGFNECNHVIEPMFDMAYRLNLVNKDYNYCGCVNKNYGVI